MDDLVNDLQERVLFMRTSDVMVCYDEHYIHGLRLSLKHDGAKDPNHRQYLDTYYSETILEDHDRKYYEHIIGQQNGYCQNINLE